MNSSRHTGPKGRSGSLSLPEGPADDCNARNLPPIAGALTWCRGLLVRVKLPMTKLQQLDRKILDHEEAKEVVKIQAALTASLLEYETQKIEEWGRESRPRPARSSTCHWCVDRPRIASLPQTLTLLSCGCCERPSTFSFSDCPFQSRRSKSSSRRTYSAHGPATSIDCQHAQLHLEPSPTGREAANNAISDQV